MVSKNLFCIRNMIFISHFNNPRKRRKREQKVGTSFIVYKVMSSEEVFSRLKLVFNLKPSFVVLQSFVELLCSEGSMPSNEENIKEIKRLIILIMMSNGKNWRNGVLNVSRKLRVY